MIYFQSILLFNVFPVPLQVIPIVKSPQKIYKYEE